MALSPFPATSQVATRAAAVATLKDALADAPADDARIAALGEAAADQVERFAPGAPQSTKDEAVIRLAGWLNSSTPRQKRSVDIAGELKITYARSGERTTGIDALRHSGARALLMPWRVRRALPVEDAFA